MGQRILVMGASGTGKSASLRNFGADEIKLIKIIGKPLPFRGKFTDTLTSDKVNEIVKAIKSSDKKIIVIDDCQYTMGNEFFRRALEKGYDKFSEIGQNFFKLLEVADDVPEDVFIYYLCHTETDVNGNEKVKTIGKMLDEKLTVEGYFTIVLKTVVQDGVYSFQTQNNGHDTVKSPMGMFDGYLIENDLKMVDGVAREYWDFSDEVITQKVVAAEKPTRKSRTQTEEKKPEEKKARTSRSKTLSEQLAEVNPAPVVNDGLTNEERNDFKAKMTAANEAYEQEMAAITRTRKTRPAEPAKTVEDLVDEVIITEEPAVEAAPKVRTRRTRNTQ